MGFGGSVSAMISSLKNNSRAKRKTYFDRDSSISKNKGERNALLDKKVTPEQLLEIRKSLAKENKRNLIKNIIIIGIAAIIIILGLIAFN